MEPKPIIFNTAEINGDVMPLRDDLDVTEFLPGAITRWEMQNRQKTALTAMQANDMVVSYGLNKDADGVYNSTALQIVFGFAWARIHLTQIVTQRLDSTPEVIENPTQDQIEALPELVLLVYYQRSNPAMDYEAIKKPKPVAAPEAPSQDGEPPQQSEAEKPGESV